MILIFGALLAVYVFCRAILPLRLKWGWKALLAVLLAVAAFKFHLLHLFGGPMFFSPVLPEGVLLAAAWLFSVLFLFFFLLLATDVIRLLYLLVLFCMRKKRTERFRVIGNRVNLALLVFAAVLATVGMVGGTGVPRVKEETISVNHLPDGADGLAVAVLADLHVDGITRADRIRKIVERTNALNPDIVIIAGDFVDGTVPVHGDDLRPLADLKARYGVFGVPGNHEYYSGYEEWMEFLPTLGIRMLHNEHVLTGGRCGGAGGGDGSCSRHYGEGGAGYTQGAGGSPGKGGAHPCLPPAALGPGSGRARRGPPGFRPYARRHDCRH